MLTKSAMILLIFPPSILFSEKIEIVRQRSRALSRRFVRYAAEPGYEDTMVKDATTSYSEEHMHAALDINIPNYASAVVTTNEVVDAISGVKDLELLAQS